MADRHKRTLTPEGVEASEGSEEGVKKRSTHNKSTEVKDVDINDVHFGNERKVRKGGAESNNVRQGAELSDEGDKGLRAAVNTSQCNVVIENLPSFYEAVKKTGFTYVLGCGKHKQPKPDDDDHWEKLGLADPRTYDSDYTSVHTNCGKYWTDEDNDDNDDDNDDDDWD